MPMSLKERQRLVSSWLKLQRTPEIGVEREDLSWVVEKVWDLCDEAPNDAFEFILAVLDRDASDATMALLCAGPLEALLRRHGPRIISRVERRARRDAVFVRLLGHVWKDALSTQIWTRVQHIRERHRARDVADKATAAG
jgi:hypothetical protein